MPDAKEEYQRAHGRGAIIDLSARAKWHLTGVDRVRYLNGQVTNDIRRATADSALQACVTTAKGRLCGVVFVSAGADALRLDADEELREALAARLERYIISDDAALEDVTEEKCLFHVLAPEPPSLDAAVRTATRYGHAGFDVVAPASAHRDTLDVLTATGILISPEVTESIRIESGTPRWGAELTEETLPPEAGLDLTAVDFHKGCYIGQEVISRIESVGHVNRRLVGLTSAIELAPGMTLHPADDIAKSAGQVTSAAWSFGLETWAALGYLKRGLDGTPLIARSADAPDIPVTVRELPLLPPFWKTAAP